MFRANRNLTVGMYFDQGSNDLKMIAKLNFENNFGQVIDLLQFLSKKNIFTKYLYLFYIPISLYYYFKFWKYGNNQVKNLFWDGQRQDHELLNMKLNGVIKTLYFLIRQLFKLARFIYLVKQAHIHVVAFPDEAYGGVLISFYCYEKKYYVLTNFTEGRHSFSINTYNYGQSFRYLDRYILSNTQNKFQIQAEQGQFYIEEIFRGQSSHKDFSEAYSVKPRFLLDKTLKRSSGSVNVLIALHNVTDAPSALDMVFETFDEWYFYIRDELCDQNCIVYVKDHPTAKSHEQMRFLQKINNNIPSNFVFIPDTYQVNLSDMDVILSCNGSILYEAAALNVAGINFAKGNAQSLSTVVAHNPLNPLLQQILQTQSLVADLEQDRFVIYNWHVRHDLKRFDLHQKIDIPSLSLLNKNSSYRSVYSLLDDKVIFLES